VLTRFREEHAGVELRLRVGFNREDLVTLLQKHAVMAGMGLGFLSLHTLVLELRAGLIEIVRLETAPVVRTWNIVRMQSKMLSPAAEALRYFILEHGEASLMPSTTGSGCRISLRSPRLRGHCTRRA
jgi:DNA-binding transcriptional LysR family regulator